MAGARWAQDELLAKNPGADVRVFVIWFRMYPGDAQSKWPRELLTDRRVEHRWDEPKTVEPMMRYWRAWPGPCSLRVGWP